MKNTLNDQFKAREREYRSYLPERPLSVLRLDGRAFHTFTKSFERPFDKNFMSAMDAAAISVLDNVINSAEFAYVQSDEISIFFTNTFSTYGELPFNGRIDKILSVSASASTGGFMKSLPTEAIPMFDARLFTVEDLNELKDYLNWRRLDARKNAISMAAEKHYSHKELIGKNTQTRWEMIQSTENATLPDDFMWGRLVTKEYFNETVEIFNKKTQTSENVVALRSRWVVKPALREDAEKLIEELKKK